MKKEHTHSYYLRILKNINKELKALEKHNTHSTTVVFKIKIVENYKQNEKALFELFKDNRMKDGWFAFKEDDIEEIKMKIMISIEEVNYKIKNASCKICGEKGAKLYGGNKLSNHLKRHAKDYVQCSDEELEKRKDVSYLKLNKVKHRRVEVVHKKLLINDTNMIKKIKKFIDDRLQQPFMFPSLVNDSFVPFSFEKIVPTDASSAAPTFSFGVDPNSPVFPSAFSSSAVPAFSFGVDPNSPVFSSAFSSVAPA